VDVPLHWPTPVLGGALGACHGLELPFVFETTDRATVFIGDEAPADLARDLHSAWVRFARVGNPNGRELQSWPQYELDRRAVMEFGAERSVTVDPHTARKGDLGRTDVAALTGRHDESWAILAAHRRSLDGRATCRTCGG